MEKIIDLIALLGGASGISTFIWYTINLKSKKEQEQAKAHLASAEADSKVADNWVRFAETLSKEYENLKEELKTYKEESGAKFNELYKKIGYLQKAKTKAEFFFCSIHNCNKRKPPLGTYHTSCKTKDNPQPSNNKADDSKV